MEAITCGHPARLMVVMPAAKPHGSGWTGLTKRVWMLLYSEGGHWTASEISQRLRFTGKISAVLREMVERGLVMRHDYTSIDGDTGVKYSVTKRCKVPRDVEIEEIEQLLQIGLQGRQ